MTGITYQSLATGQTRKRLQITRNSVTVQPRNGEHGPTMNSLQGEWLLVVFINLIFICIFQLKRKEKNIVLGTLNRHLPFSEMNEGRSKFSVMM